MYWEKDVGLGRGQTANWKGFFLANSTERIFYLVFEYCLELTSSIHPYLFFILFNNWCLIYNAHLGEFLSSCKMVYLNITH
jgi:hypothetical protein